MKCVLRVDILINNIMNIKQLKKELGLGNTKLAEFFDLTPMAYANSTAKKRYEQALCKFLEHVRKHEPLN